ncbi:MAG: GxxExxY protein [Chloracidobacterium sp.]|nr:GxxExxY protein [Chloracidobacterium sp.]
MIEDPEKIYFAEETYQVVGAAMEVYYKLGPGFLEGVYQKAFAIELAMREIPFREQARFEIEYKGRPMGQEYVADFFCFEEIIVEIKAISGLSSIDWAQVINYLKVSRKRVGLLFNFGSQGRLEWKKLVI